MSELDEAAIKKDAMREKVRQVMLSLQIRLGGQSIKDAFNAWKESTVWAMKVKRVR